ncbi:hypothetical protein SLA2020_288700 [Shorea laevis]
MLRLLALPGVREKDLDMVMFDSYSLKQCKLTLDKMSVPDRIKVYDAAHAAELVARLDLRTTGVIASGYAAYVRPRSTFSVDKLPLSTSLHTQFHRQLLETALMM